MSYKSEHDRLNKNDNLPEFAKSTFWETTVGCFLRDKARLFQWVGFIGLGAAAIKLNAKLLTSTTAPDEQVIDLKGIVAAKGTGVDEVLKVWFGVEWHCWIACWIVDRLVVLLKSSAFSNQGHQGHLPSESRIRKIDRKQIG